MSDAHAHALPPLRGADLQQAPGLEIVTERSDATRATLRLRGEMDLANADLLTAALADQLSFGHRFVRLDLSELSFLDCAGLRALVQAHNDFLAARGSLILTGIQPLLARLLAITRLDEALLIADGCEPRRPARRQQLSSVPTA